MFDRLLEIPLEDPWNAPNAMHLDSISLQDWIDQQPYLTDEDSKKRLANCTLLELGCDTEERSVEFGRCEVLPSLL